MLMLMVVGQFKSAKTEISIIYGNNTAIIISQRAMITPEINNTVDRAIVMATMMFKKICPKCGYISLLERVNEHIMNCQIEGQIEAKFNRIKFFLNEMLFENNHLIKGILIHNGDIYFGNGAKRGQEPDLMLTGRGTRIIAEKDNKESITITFQMMLQCLIFKFGNIIDGNNRNAFKNLLLVNNYNEGPTKKRF